MPKRGYVQFEQHKRKAIEGVRKFYASPAPEVTRRKISEAVKSRPLISEETRKRMSKHRNKSCKGMSLVCFLAADDNVFS